MIKPQTFMKLAYTVSEESKAIRRKVGSLIVKDNNVIAVGYNGTPSGFDNNCEYIGAVRGIPGSGVYQPELITKPEVLHAESNAIAKCARSVNSSEGADLYTTTSPCLDCSKQREYRDWETDRKSTRLNSSHSAKSRMPSSA